VAFVAPRPGKTLTAEILGAFLEGRLARFKHPREYRFLPYLPRSAAGKVVRDRLIEGM
jgi:acyl-CoA synthetase (AMP-forming)/AMP-acid ligase II